MAGMYCATKYAIRSLSENMGFELRPFGIQASSLARSSSQGSGANLERYLLPDRSEWQCVLRCGTEGRWHRSGWVKGLRFAQGKQKCVQRGGKVEYGGRAEA